MKNVILGTLLLAAIITSCSDQKKQKEIDGVNKITSLDLVAVLDTIWSTEQEPIRMRDEMLEKHGAGSEEYNKYQLIYEKNHIINEQKIISILADGWPDKEVIGEGGNRTICNVLQHSSEEIRKKYLPLMHQAVKDMQLSPQLLVRAEDRLATDREELQIYGGQMKFYPETKTFNVWPVYDPVNIDKRRAEIGLIPIKEYLKNRFDFEWNLEEQIRRSEDFESDRKRKIN